MLDKKQVKEGDKGWEVSLLKRTYTFSTGDTKELPPITITIPYDSYRLKESPDGEYHICDYPHEPWHLCFYVPPRGF